MRIFAEFPDDGRQTTVGYWKTTIFSVFIQTLYLWQLRKYGQHYYIIIRGAVKKF